MFKLRIETDEEKFLSIARRYDYKVISSQLLYKIVLKNNFWISFAREETPFQKVGQVEVYCELQDFDSDFTFNYYFNPEDLLLITLLISGSHKTYSGGKIIE